MLKKKEYTQEELKSILGDWYIDINQPLNSITKEAFVNAIKGFINTNPCNLLVPEKETVSTYIYSYQFRDYAKRNKLRVYYLHFFSTKISRSLLEHPQTVHICLNSKGKKIMLFETYSTWGTRGEIREIGTWMDKRRLKTIYESFVINAICYPSFLRQVKEIRSTILSQPYTYLHKNGSIVVLSKPLLDINSWRMSAASSSISLQTLKTFRSNLNYSCPNGFNCLLDFWNNFEVISENKAKEILVAAREKALEKMIEKFNKTTAEADSLVASIAN